MTDITDEHMREMLRRAKPYTVVILHKTQKRDEPGADNVVWEHGRRNFELRESGKLLIVCPVNDEGDVRGVSIFAMDLKGTRALMEEDPAVSAGIFTCEFHSAMGFPGDSLV